MYEWMFASTLFAVRVDGGHPRRFALRHMTDQISTIGLAAYAIGSTSKGDLVASGLDFTDQPVRAGELVLANSRHGDWELHEFSVREDDAGSGILGISAGRHHPSSRNPSGPSEESIGVLFLRMAHTRLKEMGTIEARPGTLSGDSVDSCVGSCEDWFGNSRALFVRERIFALLGYELVEVRIKRGHLVEQQRLDFSPKPAQPERN
jgi:hypothetical protein